MKTWFENNRRLIFRGAGTGLAIVLLIVLLYQNGWGEIQKALQRISLLHLVLALVCILMSRLLISLRWFVLLRSADIKISFKNTISLVFTGLFANNFLPTTVGGDVVRLAGAIQLGFDEAICLASIAADRVVNMVGMSLASPLGIWQLLTIPAAGGISQGLVGAGLLKKGWDFLKKTMGSFKLWFQKPTALILALGFAIAHMTFSFSANYILINGLGGSLPLWKVLGLFSLAYFVSLVPISINGYGVQELTVTYLLSHFGGISLPISATVAVLHRLLMVFVSLPGALTLPGIMALMDKKQDSNSI
ncbi:MAG: lysylphosphatidylglycerol synthase transmembrane domain-containing protein [Chloroflexota bacterium]